jgi:hypothetical protein
VDPPFFLHLFPLSLWHLFSRALPRIPSLALTPVAAACFSQQPGAGGDANIKGRKLLVRILDTFVRKFGTLKEYNKKLCEARWVYCGVCMRHGTLVWHSHSR